MNGIPYQGSYQRIEAPAQLPNPRLGERVTEEFDTSDLPGAYLTDYRLHQVDHQSLFSPFMSGYPTALILLTITRCYSRPEFLIIILNVLRKGLARPIHRSARPSI